MPSKSSNKSKYAAIVAAAPKKTTAAATAAAPKPFYTLSESKEFDTDPNIKVVYLTEKGIDLCAAIPEYGNMDYAIRHGYSWYQCMYNTPEFMKNTMNKTIRIVKTTSVELAAFAPAASATPAATPAATPEPTPAPAPAPINPINHTIEIIRRIQLSPDEHTIDNIADIITDYYKENGVQCSEADIDEICNNVVNSITVSLTVPSAPAALLPAAPAALLPAAPAAPAAPATTSDAADNAADNDTIVIDDAEVAETDDENTSVSSLGSISGWVLTCVGSFATSLQQITLDILPIPSNTDWIMCD